MNEETIIEKKNQPVENHKQSNLWKPVSLGGVAGILMGAGAMYAANAVAQDATDVETAEDGNAEGGITNAATVSDDMSFGEAFEAARAEVGPGGVFHWHGGIYNTYTTAEWDAMTPEEKATFAQQVAPEVPVAHVSTPTDAQPNVVVVYMQEPQATPVAQDDDVHIVSVSEYEGHTVVELDTDSDNQADVAIIDANDNGELDYADVVVTSDGDVATVGEIAGVGTNDVYMASEPNASASPDDDIRIVAKTEYAGHDVYGIDVDGDNQADIAVIDVDDSGNLSAPDIVFDDDGNYASVEELENGIDPNAGLYETNDTDIYDSPIEPEMDGGQFV